MFKRLSQEFKNLFLSGLFTLLPLAATAGFLKFTYTISMRILAPLRELEPLWMQQIPGSEIILVILFLVLMGALVQLLIIAPLVHYVEKVINKIPLVRIVYASVKTMVDFFDVPRHPEFKRKVVLIPYPNDQIHKLAFLLGPADDLAKLCGSNTEVEKFVKVFMPTSHVTTGFTMILPQRVVIETEISFEEAIKMMISCGVIHPKSLQQ